MDDHFDICRVFKISKFDIARLTCTLKYFIEILQIFLLFYSKVKLTFFFISASIFCATIVKLNEN